MLISISGKIGHGKDTLASLLMSETDRYLELYKEEYFEVKKFAGKLKDIASILLGVPASAFEDQEFKKQHLPNEWDSWRAHIVTKEDCSLLDIWGRYAKREDAMKSLESRDAFCRVNKAIGGVGLQSMTYREFLQILGTEALRTHVHENIWVNALFADYKSEKSNWIITDTRFKNELARVKELGGLTIKIVNSRIPIPESQHTSETDLDNETFDIEVRNNGTLEDLAWVAKEIFTKHILPHVSVVKQ